MARRLKAMLPPQVQQVDLEEGQEDIPPVLMAQLQQLQAKVQEGQQIVQALASEKEMLEQQLKEKEGEIQAKVHATNTGLRETEIKAMTDVEVATINAESREKIAGLQEQVGHMQAMLKLLMDGINSTAAASAGPKTEA
jgi:predicted nuclease with TOPRIM domain